MLCKSCNLKMICKTYDNVRNILHAQIDINECDFYSKYQLISNNNIIKNKNQDNIKQLREQRLFSSNAINNKNNNITQNNKSKYINCPNCNGVTVEEDIKLCSNCNKRVCSSCSTIFNGQVLCDECFGLNNKEEKKEKEVDKLDDNATEAQINSAKIKDELFENNKTPSNNKIKYRIPKVNNNKEGEENNENN